MNRHLQNNAFLAALAAAVILFAIGQIVAGGIALIVVGLLLSVTARRLSRQGKLPSRED